MQEIIMDAINYSNARQNFAKTMDKVIEDREPIIITRKNSKPVVMMSLEDYNAIEETMYLLKSPANAERLRKSIAEYQDSKVVTKDIIDDSELD